MLKVETSLSFLDIWVVEENLCMVGVLVLRWSMVESTLFYLINLNFSVLPAFPK